MKQAQLYLGNEQSTLDLGAALAKCLPLGAVVALNGDLGAGKTTLVRGFLTALGHQGAVKSPTYTLVESYGFSDKVVHHFDLYRITDPEEIEYLGLDEYFHGKSLCLVEWPERGRGFLPDPLVQVALSRQGDGREAILTVAEKDTEILDFLLKSTQY